MRITGVIMQMWLDRSVYTTFMDKASWRAQEIMRFGEDIITYSRLEIDPCDKNTSIALQSVLQSLPHIPEATKLRILTQQDIATLHRILEQERKTFHPFYRFLENYPINLMKAEIGAKEYWRIRSWIDYSNRRTHHHFKEARLMSDIVDDTVEFRMLHEIRSWINHHWRMTMEDLIAARILAVLLEKHELAETLATLARIHYTGILVLGWDREGVCYAFARIAPSSLD